MAKISDILNMVERLVPLTLASDWDNPGLQVGNPDHDVKNIIVSLDADHTLLEKALQLRANLILTHHPVILNSIRRVSTDTPAGKVIIRAIKNDMTIYSLHTNLDSLDGGVNDVLAKRLGLSDVRTFSQMGRIGDLPCHQSLEVIYEAVKKEFDLKHAVFVGDMRGSIRHLAVCGGSGGSFLRDAFESGADLLITGDVKYHQALEAESYGMALIDIGHFPSEWGVIPVLASMLRDSLEKEKMAIDVFVHRGSNPLNIL